MPATLKPKPEKREQLNMSLRITLASRLKGLRRKVEKTYGLDFNAFIDEEFEAMLDRADKQLELVSRQETGLNGSSKSLSN